MSDWSIWFQLKFRINAQRSACCEEAQNVYTILNLYFTHKKARFCGIPGICTFWVTYFSYSGSFSQPSDAFLKDHARKYIFYRCYDFLTQKHLLTHRKPNSPHSNCRSAWPISMFISFLPKCANCIRFLTLTLHMHVFKYLETFLCVYLR